MVDFYTDWCIPCKQIDSETFTNEEVINKIEKNFIPIKINAESKYGLPLFEQYKGTGYPMILFLDKNKNELDRLYGFYGADSFIKKLTLGYKCMDMYTEIIIDKIDKISLIRPLE